MLPTSVVKSDVHCQYEGCMRRWSISDKTLGGSGYCRDHAWVILHDRSRDEPSTPAMQSARTFIAEAVATIQKREPGSDG